MSKYVFIFQKISSIIHQMTGKKDFWSAAVGFILGAIGVAIVSELAKPKCPRCSTRLERGAPFCPNCGTLLKWQ